MPVQNAEYEYSVANPSDATDVWSYKIVESTVTGEFYFSEIQNSQGFLLPTALVPSFVLQDMVTSMGQRIGSALKQFQQYELLLSGTYEVTDTNVPTTTGTMVGQIESGKSYLFVIITAPAASANDLGPAFDLQKFLMNLAGTPSAEYLHANYAGDDLFQVFSFVFGTDFSADDDWANRQVGLMLNDLFVFTDDRGNVYSAFQGSGLQGGHWLLFRKNEGV